MCKIKEIISYPKKCINNLGNEISVIVLSGSWITGVTIGMGERLAVLLKRTVCGDYKTPKLTSIPTTNKYENSLMSLYEDAKSLEEDLLKLEEVIDAVEKKIERE